MIKKMLKRKDTADVMWAEELGFMCIMLGIVGAFILVVNMIMTYVDAQMAIALTGMILAIVIGYMLNRSAKHELKERGIKDC